MITKLVATVLLALATADSLPVLNPDQLIWKPKDALPRGAFGAVVRGDPHVGPYAFFGKFPAGFTVPLHWHSSDVAVVMTEGSMVIEPEHQEARTIERGGYFFLPGALRYVAKCAETCTFLAWGEKPFDIIYADPKDDPRPHASK